MQYLLACLTDTTLDDEVRKGLAKALVQHSGLTAEQMQYLLACLTDTTLDDRVRKGLAKALVQRSNLTAEQIQSLFACLTDTALSYEIRKVLAQYSKFNVQQSQQVLVYCLKNEMICTRYPSLIFSILRNYYSTNQIEQYTVLPGLSTFLTRPSTWSALAKQQALFLYDEVNGIALLRLGTQTMEIPLQLSHNLFLPLSHKAWGGNIHPIDVRISKQKTENYPLLQTIECTLLSGQEIVTTTMMLSPALASPMKLTQGLKNLMEDSMSITKQYCFQLKRVNAFLLTITFISSNESSRAEGRRLSTLQKEMEACLQTANIKNYECKLKGKEEEILKVTGDKEVIDALADMLVRQGLPMALAEVNKYNAFFKAQKTSETDDMYILTCPMQ
jgi:hypothetical protein